MHDISSMPYFTYIVFNIFSPVSAGNILIRIPIETRTAVDATENVAVTATANVDARIKWNLD